MWVLIIIDFIIKLSRLKEPLIGISYDSILMVVDRLIKYAYLILYLESLNAEDLAYILIKIVFTQHEMPKEIIFNRDKLFIL